MANYKGILSVALVSTASAFTYPSLSHKLSTHSQTASYGTVRPDTSDAIAEALSMSDKYGPQSSEARVAWDIVEEMDSIDSSAAYGGDISSITPDSPHDYRDHINSLAYLLEETDSKLSQMKELVSQIKDMELKDPSLARLPDHTSGPLKAALADAKAAVAVYGASSPEAKAAWDKLDNCFGYGDTHDGILNLTEECDVEPSQSTYRYSAAALKAHHMYDAAIETAVLDETLEAIGMIDGLATFVNVEKRRLDLRDNSVGP